MLRMWAAGALLVALMAACGTGDDARPVASVIGDAPALAGHTAQAAIESGELALDEIVSRGEALFAASFNTLDGAGRPETTDTSRSNFREPRVFPQNFNRISGPDANACSACHSLPRRAAEEATTRRTCSCLPTGSRSSTSTEARAMGNSGIR